MKEEVRIPNISVSALSLFRDCAYAYALKYKKKKQAIFWDFDVLDVGSYAHDAIDLYYKKDFLTKASSYLDILANSYHEFKLIWDRTLSVNDFKKGYTSLENHAKWEFGNLQSGISTKPLTELKIKIDGLYVIIDYVNLDTKKVIDWKTSMHANLSHKYRMQAEFYKRGYDKYFDADLKNFYFFFLYPNEWRTVKFGNEKQNKIKEEVDDLLIKVKQCWKHNHFPKNPRTDKGCNNCLYKFYCKNNK